MPAAPASCNQCGTTLGESGHCPRCLLSHAFPDEETPADDAVPWTTFSGMELYEEIQRGGMGVIYRARQTGLGRDVAVKILLRARFAGGDARERFLREARTAASLRHPNIVQIFDVGEEDGVPWFSMEHISGTNLEDLARQRPLEPRLAAGIVGKIATALDHAHRNGVLHRDLKPSNILLDESDEPRIIDFGIARLIVPGPQESRLTLTGQILGSPGYASPEQVFSDKADERSDVYGLGAVLYHLLSGRPPFHGPTIDSVLVQLSAHELPPLRRLQPGIPKDLETICLKCLRESPAARYPSAAAAADDLQRFLSGEPIRAHPPGPVARAWRWSRSHPAAAAILCGAILAAGGITVGSIVYLKHQERATHRATLIAEARSHRQSRIAGGREKAIRMLQEAWKISPSKEIRDELADVLQLTDITPLSDGAATPPSPSRSADGILSARSVGDFMIIEEVGSGVEKYRIAHPHTDLPIKLDDRGERIAIAEKDGTLSLRTLPDFKLIATCHHPEDIQCIDWSGNLIATSCGNRFIYIWDDAGRLKHRFPGHDDPFIRLAFRPGSQELASTSADLHVHLWHAARGQELCHLVTDHKPHRSIWWSADGSTLFGETDGDLAERFAVPPARFVKILSPPQEEPHSENLGDADISADGNTVVAIDEETTRLWDFSNGRLIAEIPKEPGQWSSARFSHDGKSLFRCGWKHPLVEMPLVPSIGPERTLFSETGFLLRAATRDDSHLVISENGRGRFVVVPRDGGRPVVVHQTAVLATAIAPDASWLVTSSYQKPGARVWKLPAAKEFQTILPDELVKTALPLGNDRIILQTGKQCAVFRTADWKPEKLQPPALPIQTIAASRDGSLIALHVGDHIRVLSTGSYSEICRFTPLPSAGWLGECHLTFDADASHLLAHTALGTVIRWDLSALTAELRTLLPEER